MIPLSNNDNGDDSYNINVSRYTSGDITYNYLNYKVDKIATNDDSVKFLYTSQVKKDNKDNKFKLVYDFRLNTFSFNPVNCSLDVLMIPSVLIYKDENGNLTNSTNTLQFDLTNSEMEGVEFLFKCLCFQSGLSNLSELWIICNSSYVSNIETIILNDNYFNHIELTNLSNLKYISPLKGNEILVFNCNSLKNLTIDNAEELTIHDNPELKNITINKAASVFVYDLVHLKSCVGKSVEHLKFHNIYDLDDGENETKLFDFRNTEEVEISDLDNKQITIKECFLNSLDPFYSKGSDRQTVNIEHLYTSSIYYLDTTQEPPVYKPLFSTLRSKTYIEVLTFTGGDNYYNDSYYNYNPKYKPECITTIHFTNFYCNINQPAEVKAMYRKLFDGNQNQEVYINAPIMFPAHWFDSD